MSKTIILNESSLKRLLEYIGDDEEFGRYDINKDSYFEMPKKEFMSVDRKISRDSNFNEPISSDDFEKDQFIGQEYFDPYNRDLKP